MPATKEALIQKTPGVHGGDACIRSTRVPVWILVGYHQLGWSEEKLLRNYPSLSAEDLIAAWEYYRTNPNEIDQALRDNDRLSDDD